MLPCHSVFTAAGYASKDIALPEAIVGHVKKDDGQHSIYLMIQGLQSTRVMKAFNDQKVAVIAGAKENRKFVELESFIGASQDLDLGEFTPLRNCKVQGYTCLVITPNEVTDA